MNKRKINVLIVAGGSGTRMNNAIPKQFLPIKDKPVLKWVFEAFNQLGNVNFILVLNEKYIQYWKQLCIDNNISIPHKIVEGGPTRFHSVVSGLKVIPGGELVLIHDGARPFPSLETISNVTNIALNKGNAIPVVDIQESLREVSGNFNRLVDRNSYKIVQTPQAFHTELIKEAYNTQYQENYTDDSAVLESTGERIFITEGNPENIKISTTTDLIIAEGIIDSLK